MMSRAQKEEKPKGGRKRATPAGELLFPSEAFNPGEDFSDVFERAVTEARSAVDEIYRNKYRVVEAREVARGQR